MKRIVWCTVLALLFGFYAVASAQEEEERGAGFGFTFGADALFLDMSQFGDDLSIAGLNDFAPSPPYGGHWSLFLDLIRGGNVLRLGAAVGNLNLEQHRNGRYASFQDAHSGLLVGYKRRFGEVFGLVADVQLGGGEWEFDLHSPARQGRADKQYWYVEPNLGIEAIFGFIGLGVYGTYFTEAIPTEALFSGDFHAEQYRGLDINHFGVNLSLIIGGWNLARPEHEAQPEPAPPPVEPPPDELSPDEPLPAN